MRRLFQAMANGEILFRDPALCDVCWLLLAAPGEVEEARSLWDGYEEAMSRFEQRLAAEWRRRQNE